MLLRLNKSEYYNDVCEVIRLFMPREENILLVDSLSAASDESSIDVKIDSDETEFNSSVSFYYGGECFNFAHSTPFRNDDDIVRKRYEKRCLKVTLFRTMRKTFPSTCTPWGSLTGIRPTRLLRELELTCGRAEAFDLMLNEFDVSPQKLDLAEKIVSVQQAVLTSINRDDVDIYIGVPYCRTRCLYCSFASQLRTPKTDMKPYLDALKKDIENGAKLVKTFGLNVRALYFGGGTPTILTSTELSDLLGFVISTYEVSSGTEFTVEAGRPDTITPEKLRIMHDMGVNRISINPQTMCDETLRAVGRDHNADDIENCFVMAREIGFDSINMDLIAGLPGETTEHMLNSIERIKRLDPDCLTVHTLAIKRSSRLKEHLNEFQLPPVDEVEAMTSIGTKSADDMGMLPYYMYRQKYMAGNMENVGYSKPDKVCIYNIDMMEDALSIIAHGAGAMSKRVFPDGHRIERIPNPKDIETYIAKINKTHLDRMELWGLQK